MKKAIYLTLILALLLALSGCADSAANNNATPANQDSGKKIQNNVQVENPPTEPEANNTDENSQPKVLVAYFSATNNTAGIAADIAESLGADLYVITPEEPYTAADLDYGNDNSRTSLEMNNPDARPAIGGSGVANMADYDIVFLGYPIWWGQAPKIISTFLEAYDFSGKTIVPFCTSGSSGIGSSATNLHGLTDGADWLEGRRFSGGAAQTEVANWVNGLNLQAASGR